MEPSGSRLTGRDAGMALLRHMHITRPVAAAIQRLSLEWIVERISHFASVHRSTLSRFVPDVDPPRRPP